MRHKNKENCLHTEERTLEKVSKGDIVNNFWSSKYSRELPSSIKLFNEFSRFIKKHIILWIEIHFSLNFNTLVSVVF